jgi:hypothetical protein
MCVKILTFNISAVIVYRPFIYEYACTACKQMKCVQRHGWKYITLFPVIWKVIVPFKLLQSPLCHCFVFSNGTKERLGFNWLGTGHSGVREGGGKGVGGGLDQNNSQFLKKHYTPSS